jgi:prepilin-type N-terminal cleavage/methylation domain-containing protein
VTRSGVRSPGPRRRRGFTLIELLVALLVGATVVLAARLMLEGVADEAGRVTRLAQRTDHDANADRLLRSTVAALDVGTTGTPPFTGDQRTAHFTSWCARPDGWQDRCAVTLAVTGDSAARALVLTIPGAQPLPIRTGFQHGELRYLADARDRGRWLPDWEAGLVPPIAIGVVLDADTLVLAIGERG